MSDNNDKPGEKNLAFSQDVEATIRAWMCDPELRRRVYAAVEAGPAETMTTKLGYCNIGTQENQEWKTIFPATNREKKIGEEGLFYLVGKHNNPLMRLRHQKAQTATTSVSLEEKVVNAADISLAELAARAGMTEAELMKQVQAAGAKPNPKAVQKDESHEVPPHVAAIIAKGRLE